MHLIKKIVRLESGRADTKHPPDHHRRAPHGIGGASPASPLCDSKQNAGAQAIRARPKPRRHRLPNFITSPPFPNFIYQNSRRRRAAIRLRDARAASAPDERAPWPLRRRSGLPPPQERPPGPHPLQVPLPPPPPMRWCLTIPQPNRCWGKPDDFVLFIISAGRMTSGSLRGKSCLAGTMVRFPNPSSSLTRA